MFKRAVARELLPVAVHQALTTVAGLRAGRTAARETGAVKPDPDAVVEATLPFLSPTVAAMVRVQLLAEVYDALDLRRVAEVVELDKAVRAGVIERLGLGRRVIQFHDASAGRFLREWMLDQASLFLRDGDPRLELPHFEYPTPPSPGGVQ